MKRLLSFLLVLSMMVSLLPAMPVFAETGEELKFVFDNLYNNLAGNTKLNTITAYDMTGGMWKYNSGSANAGNSLMQNNRLAGDTRAVGQYIALDLNIPADGKYNVDYTYFAFSGRGGKGDVYILPEGTSLSDIEAAKASGVKLASVDYSTDGASGKTSAECLVETVTLSKGNNILLFVVTDKGTKATTNGANDYFTYPYELTLTPVKETVPEENIAAKKSFIFDNLSIGVAGNTRVDTITSYAQTGNTWRYLSASANAKASQLKNYYLNGDTRAVDHFIALEINVPGDGIYVPEFFYQTIANRGGTGDIYILPEGGFTNLTEAKANGTKIASVDYSSDVTSGNNKAEMLVDEIALKKGTQVLLFVVTGKGAKATQNGALDYFTYPYMLTITPIDEVPPTNPSGEKLAYDFKANTALSDGEIKNIASGETAENAFPASSTDGWSAYSYSADAEYIQNNNCENITFSQKKGEYLQLSSMNVGEWIAIEIPLTKRGTYNAFLSYKQLQGYGAADIYTVEMPEKELEESEKREYISEALKSAPRVASINSHNVRNLTIENAPEAAEFTVSTAKSNRGTLLVFKTTSNKKILLDSLILDGTGELESAKSVYEYNINTNIGIAGNSNPIDAKYSDTLDTWEGFASNNVDSAQAKASMTNVSFFNPGGYMAFRIKVPASGTYIASTDYYKHATYGDKGEVYIIPADTKEENIEEAIKTGTKIASLDYYVKGSEKAGMYTDEGVEITLSKGEYIVVFVGTAPSEDKTDGKRIRNYPGAVRLTRRTEKKYAIHIEKILHTSGDTAEITLTDTNGTEIESFEVTEITSSDEAVATVSYKIVTAGNAEGRAKISATVVINGKEAKAEGYVRYVRAELSGKGVFAKLDERKESWTNPGYLRDASLYTSLDRAKTDIAGFEAGDGITSDYTNGWSWYGDSADNHTETAFVQTNKSVLGVRMNDGEWFAIKMKFDTVGKYRTIITHRANAQSPHSDVYFIPLPEEGEKVSDYLTDEYKVGRLNSFNPDVVKWNAAGAETETYLGDVYAEKPGEYLAVIMMTGRAATGNMYLYFDDITFSGTNPIVSVGGSWENAVATGETIVLDKSLVTYEADIPEYREWTTLSFESLTPDIVSVDENGVVTGIANGVGRIEVTATYDGASVSGEYTIVVGSGKTRRSYYTDEKVENAKRNIERYDWAKAEYKKYIREADRLVEQGVDKLYGLVTTQELPRATTLAYRFDDTGEYVCIYCDKDLTAEYGTYPWVMNVYSRPWKLQCPDCKRYFPSNDFGSFYELGINANGNWDYELALQKHHEKFVCTNGENCSCETDVGERGSDAWREYYGYGKGYLKNNLYGEVGTTLGVKSEEVDFWAVDDGWGYEYQYEMPNGNVETRCEPFIAYYNAWGLWEEAIPDAVENLGMAYLYTGDLKYGRAGAILLDRIADVYPDFDSTETGYTFQVADGNTITKYAEGDIRGTSRGRILGRLHDCNISQQMVPAYDALWPAYEDKDVIDYLSAKAAEMHLENKKTSASAIRSNIENRYLREINRSIRDYRISANFTVTEKLHITAAVVLDTMPETHEWFKFVFQSGKQTGYSKVTGGNVYAQIINVVDRDGHGNEASGGYNTGWVNNLVLMGEALDGYDRAGEYKFFENPKFKRMLKSEIDTICASLWTPNTGDNTTMGIQSLSPLPATLMLAYKVFDDEPEYQKTILRTLYLRMRRSYDNIHGSVFEEDPEEITRATKKTVEEELEVDLPSRDLAGYGIAILRDGDWIISADTSKNINNQRDFYIYYGQTNGHGHADKLSLGFHAFGLDVGADLGVPRLKTSTDPQRFELVEHTMAHNTVMVNNLNQRPTLDGNPMHFDSTDKVQLMDVEAPEVYDWLGVEEYRRTLVMVDIDDDVSYGVDFFRVLGGTDHMYSFHALGREAELSDNVRVKKQTDENGNYIGSYQGEDKLWGSSNVNSMDISNLFGGRYGAYDIDRDLGGKTDGLGTESWFGEVDRAINPESIGTFSADWKIVDIGKALSPANNDLGVKLTMVNSFKNDEITTASVLPPQMEGAMDKARYLFVRRTGEAEGIKGKELDSLFTAVVEPYDGENNIASIEPVTVSRADEKEFTVDEAKAVKVTLKNGREDYIVYAKDNSVSYEVAYSTAEGESTFAFSGFVGVVSVKDGKIIYTYINDGTAIADEKELVPAYTGKVTGFEKELSEENYIDIALDTVPEDPAIFNNRYIYVDNGLTDNGAYLIENAYATEGGIRLEIGDTTLITSYVDDYDFDKGYNYNISEGNAFKIPMSYVDTNAPVFDELSGELTTSAGSTISVKLNAESPLDEEIVYSAVRLPRGASFDAESATITWKPGSAQIGRNVVSIDATDASGRVTRKTFEITVYGSTTGSGGGGASVPEKPTVPETPYNPETPNAPDNPETPSDEKDNDKKPTTDVGDGVPDVPSTDGGDARFTDLGNHAWAEDAINSLADEGIIKGTSENTFSPAANITRADFAILLVRAFELSSDNTENFTDVSESDYFARELAIARNTGIVNGIGDNKFAPKNTITREDMMVIVYRALTGLGVEFVGRAAPGTPEYPDFNSVSEYAREAVSALVEAGLVNGKNGKIAPLDYTTRAEVAVLLKRILAYKKQ